MSLPAYPLFHIVGRQVLQSKIDAAVNEDRSHMILLTGIPGIGKSTLALQWARKYSAKKVGCLHADERRNESLISIASDVSEIGSLREDDVSELADVIATYSQIANPDEWTKDAFFFRAFPLILKFLKQIDYVIILDNVVRGEAFARITEELVKLGAGGTNLVAVATSCDPDLPKTHYYEIEVTPLTESEAVALLVGSERLTEGEIVEAQRLARDLDYYPLAIAQAALTIRSGGQWKGVSEYRKVLQDLLVEEHRIVRSFAQEIHYHITVKPTLQLSLTSLVRSGTPPDSLIEFLYSTATQDPDNLCDVPDDNSVIDSLIEHGILERDGNKLSIHRVFQAMALHCRMESATEGILIVYDQNVARERLLAAAAKVSAPRWDHHRYLASLLTTAYTDCLPEIEAAQPAFFGFIKQYRVVQALVNGDLAKLFGDFTYKNLYEILEDENHTLLCETLDALYLVTEGDEVALRIRRSAVIALSLVMHYWQAELVGADELCTSFLKLLRGKARKSTEHEDDEIVQRVEELFQAFVPSKELNRVNPPQWDKVERQLCSFCKLIGHKAEEIRNGTHEWNGSTASRLDRVLFGLLSLYFAYAARYQQEQHEAETVRRIIRLHEVALNAFVQNEDPFHRPWMRWEYAAALEALTCRPPKRWFGATPAEGSLKAIRTSLDGVLNEIDTSIDSDPDSELLSKVYCVTSSMTAKKMGAAHPDTWRYVALAMIAATCFQLKDDDDRDTVDAYSRALRLRVTAQARQMLAMTHPKEQLAILQEMIALWSCSTLPDGGDPSGSTNRIAAVFPEMLSGCGLDQTSLFTSVQSALLAQIERSVERLEKSFFRGAPAEFSSHISRLRRVAQTLKVMDE